MVKEDPDVLGFVFGIYLGGLGWELEHAYSGPVIDCGRGKFISVNFAGSKKKNFYFDDEFDDLIMMKTKMIDEETGRSSVSKNKFIYFLRAGATS